MYIDKKYIQTWIVTGASSGLGYELCRQLIDKGYNVVALSRTKPEFNSERALCLSCDVTNYEEVNSCITEAFKRFKEIDVLVNNAGISAYLSIEEQTIEDARQIMDTNFWAIFNLMQVFIPLFRKRGYGTIINISSECGISFRAFGAAYVSSKHALEGLTSVAWWELKKFCRVLCVELSYFVGSNIGAGRADYSQFDAYKHTPFHPLNVQNDNNSIERAVTYIIQEAEKKEMQRRLMLGNTIYEKIKHEIDMILNDLENSKEKAGACACSKNNFKHYGIKKKAPEKNVAILNFHFENVNFGAVLTSYALNNYINSKGFKAVNIDYIPSFPWIKAEPNNKLFSNFKCRYLPLTETINYGEDLTQLNKYFSAFIVGSDQVWRKDFLCKYADREAYFLSFADEGKKIISCAASFGTESVSLKKELRKEISLRLQQFTNISVREKSGVDICNDLGASAEHVIDPVFYITQHQWSDLINSSAESFKTKNIEQTVVYYTIDESIESTMKNFIHDNGCFFETTLSKNITYNLSVEEWLYCIKNCKYLITDSFHGSCFAIIFNKPFICVNHNHETSARMKSIFDDLGIKDRLYNSLEDIDLSKLSVSFLNYSQINNSLAFLIKSSQSFLINALTENFQNETQQDSSYAVNKNILNKLCKKSYLKNKVKFFKYSLLSKLLFGKKKQRYIAKKVESRADYKACKNILYHNRVNSK